jgi:hypothetical protein
MRPGTGRPAGLIATLWVVAFLLWVWPGGGRGASLLAGWVLTTGPSLLAALGGLGAGWGLGATLAARLQAAPLEDRLAQWLLEVALGLAGLQGVMVALGAVRAAAPPAVRLVVVAGLVLGLWVLLQRRRAQDTAWSPDPFTAAALVVAAGLLLPTVFGMGAPPTGADELQYHLRIPRDLLATGGFATDPDDPVSAFPRGLSMLLAPAMAFAGDAAARPTAWLLGVLSLVAGHRIALRIGGQLAGAFALIVIAGAPSFVRTLPVISSDAPLGLFLGVAVLLLLHLRELPATLDGRSALLLGLLGGAAFSIKYTAALYFGPVWMAFLVLAWTQRRRALVPLLLAALVPLLFASPWLAANMAAGLHPLYPLRGIVAPPGLEAAFRFNQTENYGPGVGLVAALRTPWDLFALGTEFDRRHSLGRLGPWPLLLLPGIALSLRRAPVRWVAGVAVLGFVAWAGPLRRVAYLLPLWPLLGVVCAAGAAELVARRGPGLRGALLGLAALVASAEVGPPWSDALDDAEVAAGRVVRDEVVQRRVDSAETWAWVAAHVPPDETVATVFVWEVLAPGRRVIWACAEECPTVRLALLEAGDGAAARAALADRGASWVVVRQQPFLRSSYPGLTEAEFAGGYVEPLRVLDELTTLHGTTRFTDGVYSVVELSDAPGAEK